MTEKQDDFADLFEQGVSDYFAEFGHRQARESPHQAWLLISIAKRIHAKLVVAELQVANQDLRPFGQLKDTNGAVNFDFAISRSEIDLRTWKTQTSGWTEGNPTSSQTMRTLSEIAVLAELKIAASTSTNRKALLHDVEKLAAAMKFMHHNEAEQLPACYLVILDPIRKMNYDEISEAARGIWPNFAPAPKFLVGP